MTNLNNNDLSKVSGGSGTVDNKMVVSVSIEGDKTVVKYRCPGCGHEYTESYIGGYATQKGYPATTCPQCSKTYWGGHEYNPGEFANNNL